MVEAVPGFKDRTVSRSRPKIASQIWTDPRPDGMADHRRCRDYTELPVGAIGSSCLRCGSHELIGALITDTADTSDPNLLCLACGYWRD